MRAMRGLVLTVGLTLAAATALPAFAAGQRARAAATALDPATLTIVQAQAAFTTRAMTSEALVRVFLARIEKYEAAYNAFILMNPTALDEARAIDKRRAAGEVLGPLAGIPVVVKDSLDMAGLPTTAGWAGLTASAGGVNAIPGRDATVVRRLRAAGAIILGKTNLPVFAISGDNANDSAAGPTHNVLNRNWAPGGSSTGTATAVAAGFALAGIAEETGGSIQNPAAAQGLVGIKPTFALVPNAGGLPQAGSTRDVFGPIARTLEDAAIMLDVLAGYSLDDLKTTASLGNLPPEGYAKALSSKPLKGARIGLYGPGWHASGRELTPETQTLYARALAALTDKGAIVVEDPFAGSGFADLAKGAGYDWRGSEALPYELDQYLRNLGPSSAVHSLADLDRATKPLFGPEGALRVFTRSLPTLALSLADPTVPPDMTDFARLRANYLRVFNAVMKQKNLDALLFPQQFAPLGDLKGGHVNATTVSEINIAGLPGVILPSGAYADGKPFALIFVGALWSESTLLSYANDLAPALPPRIVNTALETKPLAR